MDYWADSVEEMLSLLGSDLSYQERVLTDGLPTIRAALKESRFETMENGELASIVAMALAAVRERGAEA